MEDELIKFEVIDLDIKMIRAKVDEDSPPIHASSFDSSSLWIPEMDHAVIEKRYAAIQKKRRELLKNELVRAHKEEKHRLLDELSKLEIGMKMAKVVGNKQAPKPRELIEDINAPDPESDSNLDPRCSNSAVLSPSEYDLCLLYLEDNGAAASSSILPQLQKMDIKTSLCACPKDGLEKSQVQENIRTIIYQSRFVGLVLTKDCLKVPSILFACRTALYHRRRIILIHDQSSCFFPGNSEQPSFMVTAQVFRDKAVTYLADFVQVCAENIHKKIQPKMELDIDDGYTNFTNVSRIRTRAFLSHKRSSAQGIAGRLYQGLKADYKIFLDSEADFDLHDLQLIVKETGLFIFILSAGIFDSFWCLQELRSSIQNKKKIVLVRDEKYQIPSPLPAQVADLAYLFEDISVPQLVYSTSRHKECVAELKKLLGPRDEVIKSLKHAVNYGRFDKFDLGRMDCDPDNFTELEYTPDISHVSLNEILDAVEYYYGFPLEKIDAFRLIRTGASDQDEFSMDGLSRLLQRCSRLRTLHLYHSNSLASSSLKVIQDTQMTSIQHLLLVSCKHVDDEAIRSLAESQCKFKTLHLEHLPKVTDDSISLIGKSGTAFDSLEKIVLARMKITDSGIQRMASGNFEEIQLFVLYTLEHITDESLISLTASNFPKLETFRLDGCDAVTVRGLTAFLSSNNVLHLKHLAINNSMHAPVGSAFQNLPNLKNLESLTLWNLVVDDDLYLHVANSSCKKLEFVALNPMEDKHLKILFSNPESSVEKFEVKFMDHLTDAGLEFISESPAAQRRLSHLIIHSNKATDAAFCKILTNCTIESLNCGRTVLQAETFARMNKIKNLVIAKLKEEDLKVLANSNTVLQSLQIRELQFTNVESARLFGKFTNLEDLIIDEQNLANDQFLIHLCQGNLTKLQVLNLGCDKFTNDGLESITSSSFAGSLQSLVFHSKAEDHMAGKLLRNCPNMRELTINSRPIPFILSQGVSASGCKNYEMMVLIQTDTARKISEEDRQTYLEVKKWNNFTFDEINKPFVEKISQLDDDINFIQHSNEKEITQIKKDIVTCKKVLGIPLVEEDEKKGLEVLRITAEPLGTYKPRSVYDLCVLYSGTEGRENWSEMEVELSSQLHVKSVHCPLYVGSIFNLEDAEDTISKSRVVLIIITQEMLDSPSGHFALKCALKYMKRVLTAYCEAVIKFPEISAQPAFVADSDLFGAQPLVASVTFKDLVSTVLAKVRPEHSVKNSRAYICYQRNSGAPIAGRVYESLKHDYEVFIDLHSDYDLPQLEKYVENSDMMVVVLSSNIFNSPWHMEEIRFAISHKKKILFVQDYQYTIPSTFPGSLSDIQGALQNHPKVVYMPEFFAPFYERVVWELGAPDRVVKTLQDPRNSRLDQVLSAWGSQNSNDDILLTYYHLHPCKTSLLEFLTLMKTHFQVPLKSLTSLKIPVRSTLNINGISRLLEECCNLEILEISGNTDENCFKRLEPGSAKTVKHLSLQESGTVDPTALQQLIKAECVHMESLTLSLCPSLPDDAISSFLKECKNLTSLNLAINLQMTGEGLQGLRAPQYSKLRSINLDGCHNMTDVGFQYLAEGCTQLESFISANSSHVTDAGFKHLLSIRTLKNITISSLKNVSAAVFAEFIEANQNTLETLSLGEVTLTDTVFEAIGKCANLHTLILSALKGVNDTALQTLGRGICKLKKFRCGKILQDAGLIELSKSVLKEADHVNIAAAQVTNASVVQLLQGNRSFDLLSLAGTEIDNEIVEAFVSNKQLKIRQLQLSSCSKLKEGVSKLCLEGSHLGLQVLSVSSPSQYFHLLESLTELRLESSYNTESFTDSLGDSLAQSNLKLLEISYKCDLTDLFIQKLASGKITQTLEELHINGNHTEESLTVICNYFHHLINLDLGESQYFEDKHLKQLLNSKLIHSLTRFEVHRAVITADGVDFFIRNAPVLKTVKFNQCRKVGFSLQSEKNLFQELHFSCKKLL